MLPQPLLIFRKDLQHLWPETLVVLALFVAFCFAAPSGWAGSEFATYVIIIAGFLKFFLMPVSWLVVIARLIQDEPLVGDRQFWTSRPYHWAQLFAAKILYLLVFLYLPFFLMQCYLLKHAGLHPLMVIPALLHNLLLLTVILVIPIMAISAVTSTFARVLLTVVGLMVAAIVLAVAVGYFTFLDMAPPHLDWIANTLFIVLPAVALVYQYKTRRTGIARILLIATPLVAVLVYLLAPTTSLIAHAYPVASAADSPKVTPLISPELVPPATGGDVLKFRNHVVLRLPVKVQGIDDRNDYAVDGNRVTLTAPGVSYKSPFLTTRGEQLNGSSPIGVVFFYLPADVFQRIHATPVDLQLQLAAQHLLAQDSTTWKANAGSFDVPGNGVCSFPKADDLQQQTSCRYPFAPPEISSVSARINPGSCSDTAGRPVPARASLAGLPSALEFDPVVTVPLQFQTGDPNGGNQYTLCPGTELHFVQARTLPKTSFVLDAKAVVLDPYVTRLPNPKAVPSSRPQSE